MTRDELKDLACANAGIYHEVKDHESSRLGSVMAKYYGYFATGLAKEQGGDSYTIRYSEVYADATLGSNCVTGSVPVYDRTGEADGKSPSCSAWWRPT